MSTVAKEIVRVVRRRGIGHVFCVPGESYLDTLQAFGEEQAIELVSTRHEEGAGLMAEAYAKATHNAGVCLVTRGPGLTHLSIALHNARQDSTPLVAIVGQVPAAVRYRDAFQEMDIPAFARPVAKWTAELTEPERVGEIVSKAFHIATSGRPGPVVLSLPENIDRAVCAAYAPGNGEGLLPTAPSSVAVDSMVEALTDAASIAVIAGSGVLRAGATEELVRLAERLDARVYTAWRRFDAYPNGHRLYRGSIPGMPASLYAPLHEADLILAVGTRLGEFTTLTYSVPSEKQQLIYIDDQPEASEAIDIARDPIVVPADAGEALTALNAALGTDGVVGERAADDDRATYVSATTARDLSESTSTLNLERVMATVCRLVPSGASVTSDAGTFAGWLGRYYKWSTPGTFYGPTAGGMGYALPAAIGAKFARPDQPAVAFAGDGGFAMTMSEIETASRLGIGGLVAIVFDNQRYGTIALHQQRAGFAGSIGTNLGTIDFTGIARALGADGTRVSADDQFAPALERALSSDRPHVIQLVIHDDHLAPWAENLPASAGLQ